MNLFVCAVITLASLYYISFFPRSLLRRRKNAPRLSPRAQRSRLRKPARPEFRIQSRQGARRGLSIHARLARRRSRRDHGGDRATGAGCGAVGVSCKSPQRRKKEERNAHEESRASGFASCGTIALSLGLVRTQGAEVLGVSRQTLKNVIHGKSGISPDMAIRLSKAFGSTPETWLRMQLAYDLAQARKGESKIKVRRQHMRRSDPADGRLGSLVQRALNDEKNGRVRPL